MLGKLGAGRHDEALAEIRQAVDLAPLSPLVHAAWGQRLNAAGRHRQALERLRQAEALGAQFGWHFREIAYAHERLGSEADACTARVEQARRRGLSADDEAHLLAAIERDGLPGFWRWELDRRLALQASEPVRIAEAMAALGDTEAAWPWLQQAVRQRGGWLLHLLKSPAFDSLRADDRFRALIRLTSPPEASGATAAEAG